MGRKMEKRNWDVDEAPQSGTICNQKDVVGDVDDGKGPSKRRKRANTTEKNSSSSDDGGAALVVEGSSPSANANAPSAVDPRERHKLAERERRKSMRELFLALHELLPNGDTVRKEQSAILDEIIKYIPVAASRLRSLEIDAQRRCGARGRNGSSNNPDIPVATVGYSPNYSASPSFSTSSSCSSLSSSSSSSDMINTTLVPPNTNMKRQRETSNDSRYYACSSRSGSTNSLNTLAIGSPSSGGNKKPGGHSTAIQMSDDCCVVDIRVAPEPASSVSIRLRGDRVNVSLTDHSCVKLPTPPASSSAQPLLLLSAVLDELEAHQLELIRSTHCRDGSKLLHYSESKVKFEPESMEGSIALTSPKVLKRRLQDLASKLQTLRKTTIMTATCASAK